VSPECPGSSRRHRNKMGLFPPLKDSSGHWGNQKWATVTIKNHYFNKKLGRVWNPRERSPNSVRVKTSWIPDGPFPTQALSFSFKSPPTLSTLLCSLQGRHWLGLGAVKTLTVQLQRTHWLGRRPGNSSWALKISPCWYVVPLCWQDLGGARSPEGV
jgi:hypothetical protein